MELGVGYNTPFIIKYPFRRLTDQNSNATYACINHGEAVCPQEIQQQSICIGRNIGETLSRLVSVKAGAKYLALFQYGVPTEAALHDFQHQILEPLPAVVGGSAP